MPRLPELADVKWGSSLQPLPRGSIVVVPVPLPSLVLWRRLWSSEATEDDFGAHLSPEVAAKRSTSELARLANSHFLEKADAVSVRLPRKPYLGRLELHPDPLVRVARTGGGSHVDVWAPALVLVSAVVEVIPIEDA